MQMRFIIQDEVIGELTDVHHSEVLVGPFRRNFLVYFDAKLHLGNHIIALPDHHRSNYCGRATQQRSSCSKAAS
ncbi:MAG: hypothetical protein PHQ05_02340 [Sterolibacterium sp.]|nr:hypothetical protein [Sterolibacterium sp.]